jgi:hypothetical protein
MAARLAADRGVRSVRETAGTPGVVDGDDVPVPRRLGRSAGSGRFASPCASGTEGGSVGDRLGVWAGGDRPDRLSKPAIANAICPLWPFAQLDRPVGVTVIHASVSLVSRRARGEDFALRHVDATATPQRWPATTCVASFPLHHSSYSMRHRCMHDRRPYCFLLPDRRPPRLAPVCRG